MFWRGEVVRVGNYYMAKGVGEGMMFDRALVKIRYWESEGVYWVNFTVTLKNGVKVNRTEGGLVETGERAELTYTSTYIVSPSRELLTPDGRWAGPFPYLAYVDLERPTLEILGVRLQGVFQCVMPKEGRSIVDELAEAIGSDIVYREIGFGEKQASTLPGGIYISYEAEAGSLLLQNCIGFGLYPLYVDPRLPSKGYSFRQVEYPATATVMAVPLDMSSYPGRILRLGEGMALAEVRSGGGQRFFYLALSPQALPKALLELTPEDWIWRNATLLLMSWPQSFSGNALYEAEMGFLLEANLSWVLQAYDPLKAFLAPTFDLMLRYDIVGKGLPLSLKPEGPVYGIEGGGGVRVRLVEIKGQSPAMTLTFPGKEDYSLDYVFIVAMLASSIAVLVATRRAGSLEAR